MRVTSILVRFRQEQKRTGIETPPAILVNQKYHYYDKALTVLTADHVPDDKTILGSRMVFVFLLMRLFFPMLNSPKTNGETIVLFEAAEAFFYSKLKQLFLSAI